MLCSSQIRPSHPKVYAHKACGSLGGIYRSDAIPSGENITLTAGVILLSKVQHITISVKAMLIDGTICLSLRHSLVTEKWNYDSRWINKLQNGAFWLIFKLSKIGNIRLVGNLFLYLYRNSYNSDVYIMTSLVLKARSPCEIFSPLPQRY